MHPQFIIPLLAAREADAKQLAMPGSPPEDSPADKKRDPQESRKRPPKRLNRPNGKRRPL
jgi:hypothetical protein